MSARVRMVLVAGAALAITLTSASYASAYDWTDEDCTHWQGGPKYAQCAQAHARLAESDCGRWTPGEKEFVKCQHAHNVARVQTCQRAGEGMRNSARALGWDGTATVPCPLANEHTGVEEGNLRPHASTSVDTLPEPARRALLAQAELARRREQRGTYPVSAGEVEGPLPSRPAVMVEPLSWSNIQPSRSDSTPECAATLGHCETQWAASTERQTFLRIAPDLAVEEVVFGITRDGEDGEPEFLETRAVPYAQGQLYGWQLSLRTGRDTVRVREELTMPAPPASWGNAETSPLATISEDRRRAVVEEENSLYDHVHRYWSIDLGDPQGLYELRLYVEDVLVGEVTFVVGHP